MNNFLTLAGRLGAQAPMLIAFVFLIGFTYFTMLRPQKKQQQKRMEMMKALKKGDKVVTIGGLHGTIDEVNTADQTIVLDADGIFLTFNLSAIRNVVPTTTTAPSVETKKTEEVTTETTDEEK